MKASYFACFLKDRLLSVQLSMATILGRNITTQRIHKTHTHTHTYICTHTGRHAHTHTYNFVKNEMLTERPKKRVE